MCIGTENKYYVNSINFFLLEGLAFILSCTFIFEMFNSVSVMALIRRNEKLKKSNVSLILSGLTTIYA